MFKDIVKSVGRNASVMMMQHVITLGSTFFLMLFLPRYLGPVEYGRLFLAASVTDIFRIFVVYGSNYSVAKEVSRSRENTAQILVDAIGLRIVFAVVSVAGMILFSQFVGYPGEVKVLFLIYGVGLFWQAAGSPLYGCYQGHEMMQYTSAAAVAERVFDSIVGVAALLMGASAIVIAAIFLTGLLLNVLVLAGFARKIVSSLPKINWGNALKQVQVGVPYLLYTVFSTVYYRINSLMLSKMAPEAVVGFYGGAYRLFESLNFPYILTVAVYPVLSRLWGKEEQTHKRTTQKSLEVVIIAGIPISIGVIAFAQKIVQLFYGLSDYGPSILVLQVLTAGLLFLYIDMVLGTTLLASDRQKQLSVVSMLAIPVNVILNYFLIPYYQLNKGNGAIGGAIVTGITELLVMVALLNFVPKGVLAGFRFGVVTKSVIAGLFMAASLWLMHLFGIPLLAELLVSPVIYLSSLFSMRTFEPVEEAFFKELLTIRGLKKLRQLKLF